MSDETLVEAPAAATRRRRGLVPLGAMMLASGAAVTAAGFALPSDRDFLLLGQIGLGLLLSGCVIYLAGLLCQARAARAAALTAAARAARAADGAGSTPAADGSHADPLARASAAG